MFFRGSFASFWRFGFASSFLSTILFILLVSPVSAQTPAGKERPNVLLILVDDLGFGDLSSYGAEDLQTPNIDSLVQGGIRFDQFYANCPVCSPTRAALLTGRYPDLVGVPGVIRSNPRNSWGYLSPGSILISQILKNSGYDTALVGKWHLGLESPNTPNERGFDYFRGFLGDMMDDYYTHLRHGTNYMRWNKQVVDPRGHATDLFSEWAVEFLNSRADQNKPFFLYLAYNAPHTPIQPPEEWVARVRERNPGTTEKRARLGGLIEHLDSGVGRVIQALQTSGMDKNTLVLFTSDNGGQLSVGASCGASRGGKQDMYEGGIRVPMCAVWPGKIRPGTRSNQAALTMDLFPTICDAVGARTDQTVDGVSILPLFRDPALELSKRDLFWMRREGGARYLGQDYYAVRRGKWKLLQNHPFEPYQLFDLGSDPLEQRDLASGESAVVGELSDALQVHFQKAGAVPWQNGN